MSANQHRLPVFPTRMSLNAIKQKEKGATKGHALLKRKSDALTARFRSILSRIHAAKQAAVEALRAASFTLAEVQFAVGPGMDYGILIREAVPGQPAFQVSCKLDNVSGVQLPTFEGLVDEGRARQGFELTALARGGQAVAKARDAHQSALRVLLELASWQTAFLLLDDMIRMVNRRVSALEYVVIPKLDNTVQYIAGELDEQDREEFFRLKKVQGKKQARGRTASGNGSRGIDGARSLLEDDDPVKSLF